jgi:hypothetical protein
MKQVIYKYQLNVGLNEFQFAVGAKILTAQLQNGAITVWVLLNPDTEETKSVNFFVVATGQETDFGLEKTTYLNTVQDDFGLVWHVFYGFDIT